MAWPSRESVRQSEFVFRATVEKIGASTMPEVPASDRTLVASVTEVYRAPDVLRHLAGRSITVLVNDAELRAGQDVLFLARGWLYGHSLAVIEVAREVTSVDFKGLPQQLSAEAQAQRDETLTARLRRASLVVSARVAQTRSLGPVDPVTVSEHTPYWSEAGTRSAICGKRLPARRKRGRPLSREPGHHVARGPEAAGRATRRLCLDERPGRRRGSRGVDRARSTRRAPAGGTRSRSRPDTRRRLAGVGIKRSAHALGSHQSDPWSSHGSGRRLNRSTICREVHRPR